MATEAQLLRRHGGLRSRFASIGAVLLWCSLSAMMAAASTRSDDNMDQRTNVPDQGGGTQGGPDPSTQQNFSEDTIGATASNQSGSKEMTESNEEGPDNMQKSEDDESATNVFSDGDGSESGSANVGATAGLGEARQTKNEPRPDNQESKASDDQGSKPDTEVYFFHSQHCGSQPLIYLPFNGVALPPKPWLLSSIRDWKQTEDKTCSTEKFVNEMFDVYLKWAKYLGTEVGTRPKSVSATAIKSLIKAAIKGSSGITVKKLLTSGFAYLKKAYFRITNDVKCYAANADPIWYSIKDVAIPASRKYIICATLQDRLDELTFKSPPQSTMP